MITKPPKYTDPKKLAKKVESYFAECAEKKKRPTKPGLALHLGFCSRQSLVDLANSKAHKDIPYVIKRAEAMIEDALCQGDTSMGIFQLKAYCGVKEEQERANSGEKLVEAFSALIDRLPQ